MTNEQPDSNPMSEQMLDWFSGSSLPYLPPILDDPYQTSNGFTSDSWWIQASDPPIKTEANDVNVVVVPQPIPHVHVQPAVDSSNKRKAYKDVTTKTTSNISKKNQKMKTNAAADGQESLAAEQGGMPLPPARKTNGSRKPASKSASSNSNNKSNKDGSRWAEQLLNPCAAAINVSNQRRVQHLLCVINELSSLTGDANHRLAAHGLRALTQHVSATGYSTDAAGADNYATTNPKFFTVSLINFNDVNPWFRIPNSIANSSILQILMEHDQPKDLHILDIGVSHGIQWPTLLEELTHRLGRPPPRVRITILNQTIEDETSKNASFLASPTGYNCSGQLLSFAKAINLNLQINRLDNFPLLNLNSQVIKSSPDETLIICAQFRLHNLNHNSPDDRTQFLKVLKSMQPSGVVLSENNVDCSCNNCGDFATGFSRRVDYLWRFLDSTSVAYKGRESDERRMMEGEAAKALTNAEEMNEKKEKWCERMKNVGFAKQVFGEDVIDGARALSRKYDSNWEIRVEEKDGCICLWWKGQPVSFCSLWKIDILNANE